MSAPRLSIIVTTHHRPTLLPRALASIKALGAEVQIVLCADEASPATLQVAAAHLRDTDILAAVPGLRGPAETRNLGLQLAQGDYVTFLDDDDTMDPALLTILPKLDGTQVFFANYRKITEVDRDGQRVETGRQSRRTSDETVADLMVRNAMIVSSYYMPRHIARTLTFRADLPASEDWEFLIRLHKLAPFRHVRAFTSNWHIPEDLPSRNKAGRRVRVQTCKTIYQLHPAPDEATRQKRIERLQRMGLKELDDVC